MSKKISVIVPVYHVEQYLDKAILSICNQTYQNLEIILVDDGGDDECPRICDEFAAKDARIQVIHKKNGGLSDARNAGVEKATGEYIAFVDSDDYIRTDMYEILAARMEETNADIAVCNFLCVRPDGTEITERNQNMDIHDEVISGKQAVERLCGPNYAYWTTAWNRLYCARIAKSVSFPKGKLHEDEYTAHLFYDQAELVCGVAAPLYHYVIRDDSIMTKKFGIRNLDYVEALDQRIHYCMEHDLVDTGRAFLHWMPQYLLLHYGELDLQDKATMARYQECVGIYMATYHKYKSFCSLGMKQVLATFLLRFAPKLGGKILS